MTTRQAQITRVLNEAADPRTGSRLLPLVYDELRELAQARLGEHHVAIVASLDNVMGDDLAARHARSEACRHPSSRGVRTEKCRLFAGRTREIIEK